MKKLLEYIVTNLTEAEAASIEEKEDGGRTVFEIKPKEEFVGILIGKGGKTIKSIRNILKVKATLLKVAATVNVVGEAN